MYPTLTRLALIEFFVFEDGILFDEALLKNSSNATTFCMKHGLVLFLSTDDDHTKTKHSPKSVSFIGVLASLNKHRSRALFEYVPCYCRVKLHLSRGGTYCFFLLMLMFGIYSGAALNQRGTFSSKFGTC